MKTRSKYAAIVSYDGTPYHGFQRQANASPTVQGELEAALARIGQQVAVIGAGRTDAGVHAAGQVVAFEATWGHTLHALQRALNHTLPPAIAVRRLWRAEERFHPRFDARVRRYVYRVYAAPTRDPLRRYQVWHVPHPLDVRAMHRVVEALLGTHDFRSFGRPPSGTVTTRIVYEAHWAPHNDELWFTIAANAFLYRMVRRIVGAAVDVGRGRLTVEAFTHYIANPRGDVSLTLAPPHGLTLTAVEYELENDREDLQREER